MTLKYSKMCTNLACKSNATDMRDQHFRAAVCSAGMLVLYLATGIIFLTCYNNPMTFLDAVYFVVVTFTTVGFGDFHPVNKGQKLFMSVYVFLGLIVLSWGVKAVYLYWAEKKEDIKQYMISESDNDDSDIESGNVLSPTPPQEIEGTTSRRKSVLARLTSGHEIYDLADQTYKFWVVRMGIPPYAIPIIKELLVGGFLILANVAVGTIFYAVVFDDMELVNAIYFTCMTITTIGYGDVVPSSIDSRIFTIFYCLVGTLVTGRALASFHYAFDRYQEAVRNDAILTSELDLQMLFQMDTDGNSEVSLEEFIIYRMFQMKVIDPEVVKYVERQFKKLDKDNSGSLTAEDLAVAELLTITNESGIGDRRNVRRRAISVSTDAMLTQQRKSAIGSAVPVHPTVHEYNPPTQSDSTVGITRRSDSHSESSSISGSSECHHSIKTSEKGESMIVEEFV